MTTCERQGGEQSCKLKRNKRGRTLCNTLISCILFLLNGLHLFYFLNSYLKGAETSLSIFFQEILYRPLSEVKGELRRRKENKTVIQGEAVFTVWITLFNISWFSCILHTNNKR